MNALKALPKPKKADKKDLVWFLEQSGGLSIHNFDEHADAEAFGKKVRENAPIEVVVDISYKTVRIKLERDEE